MTTALEVLARCHADNLAWARREYHECRRKGLRVMTEFYRRQMVKSYLVLRGLR